MRQSFGGDTLNTALYLARLGGDAYSVGYATAIGADDQFSQQMVRRWQAENIDTRWVARCPGRLPGLYTIQVDDAGERHFSYWRQNSPARDYFDLPHCPLEQRTEEIDALYFSGVSLAILPPSGLSRFFKVLQKLRERGVQIVFDNNYRPRLWASPEAARSAFEAAYAWADVALVTLADEREVTGCADEGEALAQIRRYPCHEIVVKRGDRSTLIYSRGQPVAEVPTLAIVKVVDSTAAGDSFAAAYLSARFRGLTPIHAAESGNQLAATVIQHPGAIIPMAAMPKALFPGGAPKSKGQIGPVFSTRA